MVILISHHLTLRPVSLRKYNEEEYQVWSQEIVFLSTSKRLVSQWLLLISSSTQKTVISGNVNMKTLALSIEPFWNNFKKLKWEVFLQSSWLGYRHGGVKYFVCDSQFLAVKRVANFISRIQSKPAGPKVKRRRQKTCRNQTQKLREEDRRRLEYLSNHLLDAKSPVSYSKAKKDLKNSLKRTTIENRYTGGSNGVTKEETIYLEHLYRYL